MGRFQKKKNSTKRGEVSTRFFTKKKKKRKNMGLKHWILPKDHFKTHLFFSNFGWGDPSLRSYENIRKLIAFFGRFFLLKIDTFLCI